MTDACIQNLKTLAAMLSAQNALPDNCLNHDPDNPSKYPIKAGCRNNDNLSGYGVLRQASGVERLAKVPGIRDKPIKRRVAYCSL
jgi:hypothetical protein